ncbi:translation elongation factor Ts [Gloeomargaritaceae cyanobacterium AH-226-B11]|jgi:elongation factor Ts|nr:translation elongation factor Ts [Gloeomargaritaceae cyanobacterium AH-226-B11]
MEISAKIVKELREQTGAGMMNCKQALKDNDGDFEKALKALRLKGMATADKKSSRDANEGIIDCYIHTGNKLGILIEVNCETDFVARREEFKELVRNVAMQIASNPDVAIISTDDISDNIRTQEWEFEINKPDLANKPEEIKNKIVEGRVNKALNSKVLLEQSYIREPNITVGELIKQKIALLGENIKVKRFIRYELGGE